MDVTALAQVSDAEAWRERTVLSNAAEMLYFYNTKGRQHLLFLLSV